MQNHKTLGRVEVKNASEGRITAVFATLGVVDRDGDVTVKGAFSEGAHVSISAYNHKSWDGALPVGKGVIREVGNEAVFEGQFFLNTTHGRDTFETVKALCEDGPGMEWSYGFDVVDSEPVKSSPSLPGARRVLKKMKVHEVSPVLIGAGVDTRVLALKGANQTFTEQLTEVLASVKSVRERATDVMAMRAEKGKGLGEESLTLVKALREELATLTGELDSLTVETKNETETLTEEQIAEMRRVWLNSVRIAHEGV